MASKQSRSSLISGRSSVAFYRVWITQRLFSRYFCTDYDAGWSVASDVQSRPDSFYLPGVECIYSCAAISNPTGSYSPRKQIPTKEIAVFFEALTVRWRWICFTPLQVTECSLTPAINWGKDGKNDHVMTPEVDPESNSFLPTSSPPSHYSPSPRLPTPTTLPLHVSLLPFLFPATSLLPVFLLHFLFLCPPSLASSFLLLLSRSSSPLLLLIPSPHSQTLTLVIRSQIRRSQSCDLSRQRQGGLALESWVKERLRSTW